MPPPFPHLSKHTSWVKNRTKQSVDDTHLSVSACVNDTVLGHHLTFFIEVPSYCWNIGGKLPGFVVGIVEGCELQAFFHPYIFFLPILEEFELFHLGEMGAGASVERPLPEQLAASDVVQYFVCAYCLTVFTQEFCRRPSEWGCRRKGAPAVALSATPELVPRLLLFEARGWTLCRMPLHMVASEPRAWTQSCGGHLSAAPATVPVLLVASSAHRDSAGSPVPRTAGQRKEEKAITAELQALPHCAVAVGSALLPNQVMGYAKEALTGLGPGVAGRWVVRQIQGLPRDCSILNSWVFIPPK